MMRPLQSAGEPAVQCVVYRSTRKAETYLFVARGDDFSRVPEELLSALGRLEYVLSLDLSGRRQLGRADPQAVARKLLEEGYYLQLPPSPERI